MTTIQVSGVTPLERLDYIAGQVWMIGLAVACLNQEQGSSEGEVVVARAYDLTQQIDAVVKDLSLSETSYEWPGRPNRVSRRKPNPAGE
jgi:hypothetical protein